MWVVQAFAGIAASAGMTSANGRRGRLTPIPDRPPPDAKHYITKKPLYGPWDEKYQLAMFGMGCFWCSEGLFMSLPGVISTQVGYAGGDYDNPTYEEVCNGFTDHNEVVRVVFDPEVVTYRYLLKVFWEGHNPTTLNRQGNDRGTQYRSGIYYYSEEQHEEAVETKKLYEVSLAQKGRGAGLIMTEIKEAPEFYYAEKKHQQYEAKPGSRAYCGLRPLGVEFEL